MKTTLTALFLVTAALGFSQVTIPNEFTSGGAISASEMNANFQALKDAFDALQISLNDTQSDLDTVEAELATISDLPIGTVISSMLPPASFALEMGDTWVLADGRSSTAEYFDAFSVATIPDLRGLFLRGLNEGRNDGLQDPSARTVAGTFQQDAFQSHAHASAPGTGSSPIGGFGVAAGSESSAVRTGSPISDGNGNPRTGSETRPSNIAVYWYIKVK